jgi:hypothetical protein
MLLPDGRILVGGHAPVDFGYGRGTDMGEQTLGTSRNHADPSFQIFSPPYLFWGKRPVITGVNPVVHTGRVLTVKVDHPNDISSIRMLRNSTVTHLVDGDQRNVELAIVGRTKNAVKVMVPGSTYLPPGPYLLFAHSQSAKGEIPSVARQVFVDTKLPAAQVHDLTTRQAGLVAQELRAGVPTVPVTSDPTGSAAPLAGKGGSTGTAVGTVAATLPGAPIRTSTSRRSAGRRRSATLVRRPR